MTVLRWKELLLASAVQLLLCSRIIAQPTPSPTIFEGYDYTQCLIDVFQSDTNGDGFISKNEAEYLTLLNNIGASFCFSQTTPLTAQQQIGYLELVCEVVPDNCFIDAELPTNTLTPDQIIRICERTRESIFTTCPEPTVSPGGPPPPTTPAPSPSPITASPVVPQPPSTMSPTSPFEPVAPNITLAQCRQDLADADADSNDRITEEEFVTFIELMGLRVCYVREGSSELTQTESDVYDALICLASVPCDDLTEIVIDEATFTPSLAFTLCSVTYFSAMGEPTCESAIPTASPTIVSNLTEPPMGSDATSHTQGKNQMVLAAGAASILVYMWI